MVGVTGSTGKTTTKDILVAMLRAAGVAAQGTPGNRNTESGCRCPCSGLAEGCEVAVIEMGMRGLGQIAELAALAPPDVACITNDRPGAPRAARHGRGGRRGEGRDPPRAARPGGTAVVPDGRAAARAPPGRARPGREGGPLRATPRPVSLDLSLSKAWELRNAAAALRLLPGARHAARPRARASRSSSRRCAGRSARSPAAALLIEDCYNANPIAMRAALADLAGRSGRRVAVLADMMELGPDEERFHREVGEAAAAEPASTC